MGELSGKRALVTGGSRGIGRAVVLAFARAGADVAFCHLDDGEAAASVAAEVQGMGRKAWHLSGDVSDMSFIRQLVDETSRALGGIDILFNNAGSNIRKPFEDVTEEDFDRVVDMHLKGMFFVAQAVYRGMLARGEGCIINVASQLGIKGAPDCAPYCAAKAGIAGFTRALAWEAAPKGIRVNAIAPGPIDTDLVRRNPVEWQERFKARLPAGRFGTVEEIAATALLLAGPQGGFYVGATLSPNGGDIMH